MTNRDVNTIMRRLLSIGRESEWIEFKHNKYNPIVFGEAISALANGACLVSEEFGYLVYGVKDGTLDIVGTTFDPHKELKGKEELITWTINMLSPKFNFEVIKARYSDADIVIIRIPASSQHVTRFQKVSYIRVGSHVRRLADFPAVEKRLWKILDDASFETGVALSGLTEQDVIKLLDTQIIFDFLDKPYPSTRLETIARLLQWGLIKGGNGSYSILNLGAILFAKELVRFPSLSRKIVRVVVYDGTGKVNIVRQQEGIKGYAVGFEGLVNFVLNQVASNEIIEKAVRREAKMYPDVALRELIANAIIHQDFSISGAGVLIEIYRDRIEISNPGTPAIKTDRFIDEHQSRNEKLAYMMRQLGFCEELGSGIDRVLNVVEIFQLPAPKWEVKSNAVHVSLYAQKKLKDMDKDEKIRACYQHCVLQYVHNQKMNNKSLRARLGLSDRNSDKATRIIDLTEEAGKIKSKSEGKAKNRWAEYLPYWA